MGLVMADIDLLQSFHLQLPLCIMGGDTGNLGLKVRMNMKYVCDAESEAESNSKMALDGRS